MSLEHCAALSLVARLGERCRRSGRTGSGDGGGGGATGARERGVPLDMYSSLKYSTKKHSLGKAAIDVSGVSNPLQNAHAYLVGGRVGTGV